MTPSLATAWENVAFTPTTGTAYQQVNLMIADNQDATVSDASYVTVGIMQVLLVYPIGTGAKAAATRADSLLTTFKRGIQLTSGGIDVEINKTPVIAPAQIDGAFYKLPVSIYFKTFISL
jgi:hypothetical protein